MNTVFRPVSWALLLSIATGMAAAQESPPTAPAGVPAAPGAAPSAPAARPAKTPSKSTAQIDAGEPQANTSPPSGGGAAAGPSSAAGSPPAGSPPAASPAGAPAGSASRTGSRTAAARPGGTSSTAAGGPKSPGGADRLSLGTATVTGDREQPKVMYIVPWKRSDIGDLSGKPMNSLLDEALAPVDREEFKREVAYFDAVNADTPRNGGPAPAKQGEK